MIGWKTAVVAVVAGVGFHALNDFRPSDTYVPAWSIDRNIAVDGEFSESYYQARALFRERAKQAHATLHTLPLNHLAHLDLTIDVAVIPGTDGHVFLHMSGTHGVEGFTGSAIQSRILRDAANLTTANGPTVVLIHAVNPYGFSQLRRVNENNVDLNRNWLSPEQFADATTADPNQNGYDDIYDIINPQPVGGVVQMNIKFWFSTLVKIAVKGLGNVKASMVAATYHHTTGLFFGGQERQPSLVLLEQFLKHVIKIGSVKSLTVLDVHTGLGPSGVDTLVITPVCAPGVAESVFGEENAAGFVASTKDSGNAVMAGYATSRGYVTDGIASLAPAELHDKLVTVGQEFGTVPMIFVKKALIEENAFYHHAPTRRLPFAEKLRDVFYVHQSPSWRQSIMHRGITVFQKLYKHHENSI